MYLLFIFFIIILIIRVLYVKKYRKKTDKNNNVQHQLENNNIIPHINIKYLTKDEACDVLIDEKHEKYISNFTVKEMKSRYCISQDNNLDFQNINHNRLVNECKLNYCKNVLSFNQNEIDAINKLIQELVSGLLSFYPKFPVLEWNFIKSDSKIENGLPHTRNRCIILPESEINKLIDYQKNKSKRYDMTVIGTLLLHEKIHIIQRYNKEYFSKMYKSIWPFKKANKIYNLPKNPNQRSNPDALDETWVYKAKDNNWYLPTVELSISENYNIKYPDKVAIPLEYLGNDNFTKKSESSKINLNSIIGYYNEFCKIYQNYHPNEISAVLMSKLMINKIGYTKLDENELKCLEPLNKWLNKTLT